ncbi:MAG TPA: SWIM zinc finger family protein [Chthonomonadaceae bacterium]|nr:SWIM zinc finger family protein [Chthonomonadaceae bacterium]
MTVFLHHPGGTIMPYWDYYEPTRPREAKGGIKAQSKSGFGSSWWAKRWLAVLDSYGLGARLSRGRSYARSGQVLSIDIEKGLVRAKVQGSQAKPYKVTMNVRTLTAAQWETILEALSGQALFAAKLLAGEMPQDIEEVFQSVRLPLFPTMKDLETDCSCPDWSNPCKHTAAVYCLLGEEFDRDPFLLFTLRGITREELLTQLTGLGVTAETDATQPALPPEPLTADLTAFWQGALLPEDLWGEVRRPPVAAALVKRLGNFPFWRGATPLLEAVEPIYTEATTRGLNVYLGEATT